MQYYAIFDSLKIVLIRNAAPDCLFEQGNT